MRYPDYDHDDDFDAPKPGHSMLGIASFCIVLASGVLELGLLVIAGVLESQNPGGMDDNSPQAMFLGLALIGGLLGDIVGIVVGVIGLNQSCPKKAFAWFGVGIGATVLMGMLFVMAFGVLMS